MRPDEPIILFVRTQLPAIEIIIKNSMGRYSKKIFLKNNLNLNPFLQKRVV